MKRAKDPLQARFGKAIGHPLHKIVASVHVCNTKAWCDVPLCLWLFFDTLPAYVCPALLMVGVSRPMTHLQNQLT